MFGICILTSVMVMEREMISNTTSMHVIHLITPTGLLVLTYGRSCVDHERVVSKQ